MARKTEGELPLRGLTILVAEDEFLIGVDLAESLREAGADIRVAADVAMALRNVADGKLSAALLDIRLGRQTSEAVADALAARGIPFLFYSGHEPPAALRGKHPQAMVLIKPAGSDAVIEAVRKIARR